jgi:hypothetical protein
MALSWATIGLAFEFGQLVKPNAGITSQFGSYTTDYFQYGIFDINDILQTILGCFLALLILVKSERSGQ